MIQAERGAFRDEHGRARILRGVNLGGSSKVPFLPNGATWRQEDFLDWHGVSFVGRPFPLAEADDHFRRLAAWGMRFVRFVITWEAVEHDAPGQYDEAYLDYLRAVLAKAAHHGIDVFIDPHQDVWSRWTGGDGAPAWTLELAGFDLAHLHATGAAFTHQGHGDPFPQMIWPSNYTKLATATMFTLFFGGDRYAPHTRMEGESAQSFLQRHFIAAMVRVAERVADLPNIVGFDSLNEPSGGFIGQPLDRLGTRMMTAGATPTPFQAMLAGAGYSVEVEDWDMALEGSRVRGTTILNPQRLRAWRSGYDCIWKQHGLWTDEDGTPRLLRPDYFLPDDGKPIDIATDWMKPFMIRYIEAIRAVMPNAVLFVEGVPGGEHPRWTEHDPANAANASHWYDVMTLYHKRFFREKTLDWGQKRMVEGAEYVQATFNAQLAAQKQFALDHMNGMPTLIGEFGLPFDLEGGRAYRDGDFSEHVEALSMYYDAMDGNLLGCTLWNYTPDNTNAHGDHWNGEDLSIYSIDQRTTPTDPHSGARALEGYVRPYALAVQGEPLAMRYDRTTRTFTLAYTADTGINAPTLIYVPDWFYPTGKSIGGSAAARIEETDDHLIAVWAAHDGEASIVIAPV